MSTVISVENVSKLYRLGEIGTGSLAHDVNRWWHKARGKEDPYLKIGQSNDRTSKGESDYVYALKDVSFEAKQGEVLGIIGRNGAGKSTLLKILSRVTTPTTGEIKAKGRIASLLEVGTGFHPELSGRDNIYLNGAILGMRKSEIASKFDEIVEFSGCERYIDTPVKRYSSGMYVRLAFAVAAHLETEILIVDEVLAVGDAEFQKKCLGKMKDVAGQGRTVMFVSHQMNAVEQLCSRALLLENGTVSLDSFDVKHTIQKYLFSSHDEEISASSQWTSETDQFDNDWLTPTSIYLTDDKSNRIFAPIPKDSEIWIKIEMNMKILDPALTLGYAIYSESGELLYWTYQTDTMERNWPTINLGKVCLNSRIPTSILNEGLYRIELIGGLHNRQWLFEPGKHNPQVLMKIQGRLSDSPMWMNKRPGLLAPIIQWNSEI